MLGFMKKKTQDTVFTKSDLEQMIIILEDHYVAHTKLRDIYMNPPKTVEMTSDMADDLKEAIKREDDLIESITVLGNKVMDALDDMR